MKTKYQLFEDLRPEEFGALRADIKKRGILVPVEVDEQGNILDGHNRDRIAKEFGLHYETIVRQFSTEEEKHEHVIKLNLARRHLDPLRWGQAFRRLLQVKKIKRGAGRPSKDNNSATIAELSTELGVPSRTAEHRLALADRADEILEAWKAEPEKFTDIKEKLIATGRVNGLYKQFKNRKASERIKQEPPVLPTGPFRVIVADPPWEYENRAKDAGHRAANPYPSMTIDSIKSLAIEEISHSDAVLWLWTTNAHLPESFSVAEAWGFTYKTLLTWVKDKMGLGDWLRGKTEHCLLCTRGKPVVNLTNETTVLVAPAGEHSQKPELFYELVEKLCPGSKAELFSRTKRKGWAQHGNELPDGKNR